MNDPRTPWTLPEPAPQIIEVGPEDKLIIVANDEAGWPARIHDDLTQSRLAIFAAQAVDAIVVIRADEAGAR